MDTGALKSFGVWARTALIREVGARVAAVLAPASPERVEQPKGVAALEKAIGAAGGGEAGRAAVVDRVAYTWFNRLVALRFMDANGYTGIGVVSPRSDSASVGQPEILAEAKRGVIDSDVVSPVARESVTGLLNGTRRSAEPQAEAYGLLLAEYCRYWNRFMPFMFERAGDFTELLMPANLLADDSVLNRAVEVLTEDACQDVEVIGWLYQFYIAERKDEVFAGFKKNKKAGAEEIPAATQLFTPHWIVRYLVENSLGRLWMLNHPSSRLIDQMEYYIPSVDGESDFVRIESPEEITVIDPACGSGHMLTYAFDLLYLIYEESGYSPAEIPRLILRNNLHGTEIDARAGALAAFALVSKARSKQRTFFARPTDPNILVLEPVSFSTEELGLLLENSDDSETERAFWLQFKSAETLGSLIRPSNDLVGRLEAKLDSIGNTHDLFTFDLVERAKRAVRQAAVLARSYSVVLANPPYMGAGNMGAVLSEFAKREYPLAKSDLFAMFIERCRLFASDGGAVAMITMHSWMFLGSYEKFREWMLRSSHIATLAHLGTGAFDSIAGEVVATAAFVLMGSAGETSRGVYVRLVDEPNESAKAAALRSASRGLSDEVFAVAVRELNLVPGCPVAYWLSPALRQIYSLPSIGTVVDIKTGVQTGDNARFLRHWHEVSFRKIGIGAESEAAAAESLCKWFPLNKGGERRRWYGNQEYVINWERRGSEIRANADSKTGGTTLIRNADFYFRKSVGWSQVTSANFSARVYPRGFIFGSGGGGIFGTTDRLTEAIAVLNSAVMSRVVNSLSPTMNYDPGPLSRFPFAEDVRSTGVLDIVEDLVAIHRKDWDRDETSWGFVRPELVSGVTESLSDAYDLLLESWRTEVELVLELERKNNEICLKHYGLHGDVDGRFEVDELTLRIVPPAARDDFKAAGAYKAAMVQSAVSGLVSYAVGCMFGRYSLDLDGLILADQGSTLEEYLSRIPSPTFMPDRDNVIPIVDGDWFDDDIVERFRRFLRVTFGEKSFEDNLRFVVDALGVKDLRDYFVKSFYKDHVQRYKKRPIYWLFSSPKGSFNALIYMHRYNSSTVSTVLNEYLREFKAKLQSSLQIQDRLAVGEGSARQQAAAIKEADRIRAVLLELNEYEDQILYPLASQQVEIDLDDGVKVNYAKFGAGLKKIPGLEAAE